MSHAVVKLENVVKTYFMGDNQVQALRGISFQIQEGEFNQLWDLLVLVNPLV